MLTKELKLELVEFIIKKARPNLPLPLLHAIKEEIFKQLNSIFDFNASSELCLSLYYGTIFNTLSQLPIGPLNAIEASTTEGASDTNWLVSKDFFQQLLIHHRESLLNNPEIQDFLSILKINKEEELATLLFKSFNDYLVENFTSSLTIQDLMSFIHVELEYMINQQMEDESSNSLTEEHLSNLSSTDSIPKTATLEELQLALTHFLDNLAPKLLDAMSQDKMFQACEYSIEELRAKLLPAFQLRVCLESILDQDETYTRNDLGYFMKDEERQIWTLVRELYQAKTLPIEKIEKLFLLMNTSEAGFETYQQAFFKEFTTLIHKGDLNVELERRFQEILSQLAYLKTKHDFIHSIRSF